MIQKKILNKKFQVQKKTLINKIQILIKNLSLTNRKILKKDTFILININRRKFKHQKIVDIMMLNNLNELIIGLKVIKR